MPILNTFSGGGGGVRIPLEAPTGFSATVSDGTVSFTWTDPVDKVANPGGELVSEWNYTLVVRKAGSAPLTPTDGYQVLRTTSRNQYAGTPYIDTGLDNDVTYYYAIYAYTTLGVQSEALIGNATPTYFASISYSKSMGYGTSFYNVPISGRNSSYALFLGRSGQYVYTFDRGSKVDSNLVASTFTPIENDQFSSSARAGQYALYSYYNNTISIDGNMIQTKVDSGIYSNGARSIGLSSTDIDGEVAYVCTATPEWTQSPWWPEVKITRRYSSDLVSSNVGAVSDTTDAGISKTLGSKHHAIFTGFTNVYGGIGHNLDISYCYNTDGLVSSIHTPLCQGEYVSTSRCDDYALIYGGDNSNEHNGAKSDSVYAINENLVVTQIASLTAVASSKPYDAKTNGLGIVFPNSRPAEYYDKNLTKQGNVPGSPSDINGDKCTRVGKYLLIPNGGSQIHVFENA